MIVATVIGVDEKFIYAIGLLEDKPVTFNIDKEKCDFDISDIIEKEIKIEFTENDFNVYEGSI